MKTAQIDIAYVNPVKPGKKMGSIKTRDGVMYFVYGDKLHLFKPGPCTIEYKDDPGSDGKPFLKALGVVGAQPTAQHNTAAPWPGPNGNGKPAPHSNKDEMIFVMNQAAAAINAGQIVVGSPEYIPFINKLRSAFSATFGADEEAA